MMNVVFIVSFAGLEQENLIQELAKFTHQQQGKWLSSRISYLDGHIAANIKIESPPENKATIINRFSNQEKITCYIEDVNSEEKTLETLVSLTIKAADRSGLVSDITHIINQHQAKVVHIQTHRFSVPPLGSTVFTAEIEIKARDSSIVEALVTALKAISEDIIINKED